MKKSPKYPRYQDYVIREGRLIGEFEQKYKDFEDPWYQTIREGYASEKAVTMNLLERLRDRHGVRRVVEIGCGYGDFCNRISSLGLEVIGIDISETAIRKAQERHGKSVGNVRFLVGEFQDFELLSSLNLNCILMAEVTWYVLEHLDSFRKFLSKNLPDCFLIHLLMTYEKGQQKYGCEHFTDLEGILDYFNITYLEYGMVNLINSGARTWFLGCWNTEVRDTWFSNTNRNI